ncbi:hypothetical protein EIP91_008247 [Steccherinum ochraceum]|uniref:Uncharacterized protein n=1 Tax=Steccherinum ochraceum TaxID=92696 RepID=A0A4R0R5V5_9APHY|nr:hypothetical protein EIP91_008247 [Steccherinum ochraceum]
MDSDQDGDGSTSRKRGRGPAEPPYVDGGKSRRVVKNHAAPLALVEPKRPLQRVADAQAAALAQATPTNAVTQNEPGKQRLRRSARKATQNSGSGMSSASASSTSSSSTSLASKRRRQQLYTSKAEPSVDSPPEAGPSATGLPKKTLTGQDLPKLKIRIPARKPTVPNTLQTQVGEDVQRAEGTTGRLHTSPGDFSQVLPPTNGPIQYPTLPIPSLPVEQQGGEKSDSSPQLPSNPDLNVNMQHQSSPNTNTIPHSEWNASTGSPPPVQIPPDENIDRRPSPDMLDMVNGGIGPSPPVNAHIPSPNLSSTANSAVNVPLVSHPPEPDAPVHTDANMNPPLSLPSPRFPPPPPSGADVDTDFNNGGGEMAISMDPSQAVSELENGHASELENGDAGSSYSMDTNEDRGSGGVAASPPVGNPMSLHRDQHSSVAPAMEVDGPNTGINPRHNDTTHDENSYAPASANDSQAMDTREDGGHSGGVPVHQAPVNAKQRRTSSASTRPSQRSALHQAPNTAAHRNSQRPPVPMTAASLAHQSQPSVLRQTSNANAQRNLQRTPAPTVTPSSALAHARERREMSLRQQEKQPMKVAKPKTMTQLATSSARQSLPSVEERQGKSQQFTFQATPHESQSSQASFKSQQFTFQASLPSKPPELRQGQTGASTIPYGSSGLYQQEPVVPGPHRSQPAVPGPYQQQQSVRPTQPDYMSSSNYQPRSAMQSSNLQQANNFPAIPAQPQYPGTDTYQQHPANSSYQQRPSASTQPEYSGSQYSMPHHIHPQHAGSQYANPQHTGSQHTNSQHAGSQYANPQHANPPHTGLQYAPQHTGPQASFQSHPSYSQHLAAPQYVDTHTGPESYQQPGPYGSYQLQPPGTSMQSRYAGAGTYQERPTGFTQPGHQGTSGIQQPQAHSTTPASEPIPGNPMIVQLLNKINQIYEVQQEQNRSLKKMEIKIRDMDGTIAHIRTGTQQRSRSTTPSRQRRAGSRRPSVPSTIAEGSESETDEDLPARKANDGDFPRLRRAIRETVVSLFGHTTTPSNLREFWPPLTDSEVTAIADGAPDAIIVTEETFRIDLSRGWKTCELNQNARSVFIKHFLAVADGGGFARLQLPARLLDSRIIGDALDAHVGTLRRKVNGKQDVQSVLVAYILKRMQARRGSTWESRAGVLSSRGLTRHLGMFMRTRPCHMSGDETDAPDSERQRRKLARKDHPCLFIIIDVEWRSEEFKNFCRLLDLIYRDDWADPLGRPGIVTIQQQLLVDLGLSRRAVRTKGQPPRTRVDRAGQGGKIAAGAVPKNLYRNCYNADWLAALPEWRREELRIIDEDFDFTIPAELLPARLQDMELGELYEDDADEEDVEDADADMDEDQEIDEEEAGYLGGDDIEDDDV